MTTASGQESTLALITLNQQTKETVDYILSQGFVITQAKEIKFSLEESHILLREHRDQSYYDKFIQWLSTSIIYAMVLSKPNGIQEWKHLMGPANYKKARKTHPHSIRALFGKNKQDNVTFGSDSIEQAQKEIEFVFKVLKKPTKPSQIPVRSKSKKPLQPQTVLAHQGRSRIPIIRSFRVSPEKPTVEKDPVRITKVEPIFRTQARKFVMLSV
ncbi:nucleoside diphosphate kinase [Blakeslea trispora]|nr:nucleoside diphosphate kinase [Blakeslea trispora]